MKTVEVRTLLNNPREIEITDKMISLFNSWMTKFQEKTGRNPSQIDIFYAGYIMANPIVAEQFKAIKSQTEEPEKDLRFN